MFSFIRVFNILAILLSIQFWQTTLSINLLIIQLLSLNKKHSKFNFFQNFQWQSGLVCSLLNGLIVIVSINRVPNMQVFVPLSWRLILVFLKGTLYVLIVLFVFSFVSYVYRENECGSTLFSLCGIWIKELACTLWSSYDIGIEECQDTIIDRYILGEGIHSFINILFRICFDSSKRFSQELTCFLLY